MSFKEHGFEIFRGMIDSDQCLDLIKTIREMWDTGNNCLGNPHPCDIIGLETVVSSQTIVSYKNILDINNRYDKPVKANDLYLFSDKFRRFIDNPVLMNFLYDILGRPILVSTLNIEYGTEQRTHADAMFTCPPKSNKHITIWFALEDTHSDSGRVGYYPGTHLVEPYVFSNGNKKMPGAIDRANGHFSRNKKEGIEIEFEYDNWLQYAMSNMKGQRPLYLDAKAGDVMAWHGSLIHFGSPRINPNLTRKSAICFFHSSEEYEGNENVINFGTFDYLYKPFAPRSKSYRILI